MQSIGEFRAARVVTGAGQLHEQFPDGGHKLSNRQAGISGKALAHLIGNLQEALLTHLGSEDGDDRDGLRQSFLRSE